MVELTEKLVLAIVSEKVVAREEVQDSHRLVVIKRSTNQRDQLDALGKRHSPPPRPPPPTAAVGSLFV